MAKLTDDDVLHLANLARIHLNEDEVSKFKAQLNETLNYVEQLNEIDTTGLEPTSQVTGLTNVYREDKNFTDTMSRDTLLDQAPEVKDGMLKVPKII